MRQASVKRSLKIAIISLLTKKDYLDITVTDLIKEAGVARASFYRLYSSVDDVLDDAFDDVKDNVVKNIRPAFTSKSKESIVKVLEYFYSGVKNGSIPLETVLPQNRKYILFKFEKKMSFFMNQRFDSMEAKYRPGINIGIIVFAAMIWAYDGFKETPHELAEYVYTLVKH